MIAGGVRLGRLGNSRIHRRILLVATVGLGLVGCGASSSVGERDGGAGDASAGPAPLVLTGSIEPACGPADGPALRVRLWSGTREERGGCDAPMDEPVFNLYWWGPLEVGTWLMSPDDGSVDRCVGTGSAGCLPW